MSVLDELNSLANVLQSVQTPGGQKPIQAVYYVPNQAAPTTEDMPAFVLYYRTPHKIEYWGQIERRMTTYIAQLLYLPTAQGTLAQNYADILAYAEPTLDALLSDTLLGNSDPMYGVRGVIPNYGEPRELAEHWSGQAYFGMEFTIDVIAWRAVTIGN
jgi:hypothetical protein